MSGLLVSVRSASEARIALDAGADVIDVKEPARGPLGAADLVTISEIAAAVETRAPLSVALGEMLDVCGHGYRAGEASILPELLPATVCFAKLGLAGGSRLNNWRQLWRSNLDRLPSHVAPVAVIYADWHAAGAPRPEEIVETAVLLNCSAVLVDTFCKDGCGLLSHCTVGELTKLAERVHAAGKMLVLAGSLNHDSIGRVLAVGPDLVAVRGAACEGSRVSSVSFERVQQLKHLLLRSVTESPNRLRICGERNNTVRPVATA